MPMYPLEHAPWRQLSQDFLELEGPLSSWLIEGAGPTLSVLSCEDGWVRPLVSPTAQTSPGHSSCSPALHTSDTAPLRITVPQPTPPLQLLSQQNLDVIPKLKPPSSGNHHFLLRPLLMIPRVCPLLPIAKATALAGTLTLILILILTLTLILTLPLVLN